MQRLSYFKLLANSFRHDFHVKPRFSFHGVQVMDRVFVQTVHLPEEFVIIGFISSRAELTTFISDATARSVAFSRKRSSPNNSLVVYFQVEALESLPQISQNVSSTPTIELHYVSVAKWRKHYQHFTRSCFHRSSVYLSFKCEPHLNPSVFPKNDWNVISPDNI